MKAQCMYSVTAGINETISVPKLCQNKKSNKKFNAYGFRQMFLDMLTTFRFRNWIQRREPAVCYTPRVYVQDNLHGQPDGS